MLQFLNYQINVDVEIILNFEKMFIMIITLKINKKSKAGSLLASMIELFSKDNNDVEILVTPNFETLQAMEDAINGKVIRANSAKELISSLKS